MTTLKEATLTPDELAAVLKVSKKTLERYRKDGRILEPLPATSAQQPRWLADEVAAWLQASTPSAAEWKTRRQELAAAK